MLSLSSTNSLRASLLNSKPKAARTPNAILLDASEKERLLEASEKERLLDASEKERLLDASEKERLLYCSMLTRKIAISLDASEKERLLELRYTLILLSAHTNSERAC